MSRPVCDGCLLPASDEHVALRLQRLEWATRFRPIHIQLLLLAEAPPPRLQDYFYYPAKERSERGGLSRVLFDELMQAMGIESGEGKADEVALAEFQRRGFFLADSLECPVEEIVPGVREGAHASAFDLSHRYGPVIVKRILHSYKPRHIALLSTRTRHLLPFLDQAGLRDRLLLFNGLPLHFPHPHNPAAQAQFRAGMAAVLKEVAAHLDMKKSSV